MTRPIAHAIDRSPPQRTAENPISTGARPRIALTGAADPARAYTARQAAQTQLDTRLAQTAHASDRDLGAARLAAPVRVPPVAPPARPAVPAIAPPSVPPSPWQRLPATARARLDEHVGPALDRRISAITARAHADTAQTQTELARLDADHQARAAAQTQQARERTTALRDAGTARTDSIRVQWRGQSHALRNRCVEQAERDHATMEAAVQTSVHAGELHADAILTGAETDANATHRTAEARAAQIRASAETRAAAARSRAPGASGAAGSPATMRSIARQDGGGGGDEEARAILEQAEHDAALEIAAAQRQIHALITGAHNLSHDQLMQRLDAITEHINQLRVALDAKVHQYLGASFPDLDTLYTGQIDTLINDIQGQIWSVSDALVAGNTALALHQLSAANDMIARRTTRLQSTLEDAAVLTTFADVDHALDGFGLHMTAESGRSWTRAQRELAVAQAIRLENAFRDADRAGLLREAGLTAPGAAFQAIMGGTTGVTMNLANPTAGGLTSGAITGQNDRPRTSDYYSITADTSSTWMANATMFHFGHEFGHVFNNVITEADDQLLRTDRSNVPYTSDRQGTFDLETIYANGTAIAGRDPTAARNPNGTYPMVPRFVVTQDMVDTYQARYGDDWRTRLQADASGQGLRTGTLRLDYQRDNTLRMLPYQQHLMNSNAATGNGEWFADIFDNWANGTLADNASGDAVDSWMDINMQSWIRMRLEANGQIDPLPVTDTGGAQIVP